MTKRRCRHFDPREAGAAISLRSDRGVVTSGGVVDSWTSTAGSVVANGSGTQRPAFVASDANFGGFPALTFDAINDTMTLTGYSPASASFRCLVVCRPMSNIAVQPESTTGTAGITGQRYVLFDYQPGAGSALCLSSGQNATAIYEHSASHFPPRRVVSQAVNSAVIEAVCDSNQLGIVINGSASPLIGGSTDTPIIAPRYIGDWTNTYPAPNSTVCMVITFNTAIDLALAARVRHAAAYAFNLACS